MKKSERLQAKFCCLFVFILLITVRSVPLMAQTKSVTGTVLNAGTSQPVAGASVTIKGAKTGIATNDEGVFSLSVPGSAVLVISAVGYEPLEVSANSNLSGIMLSPVQQNMEQVVVIGYGTQKKSDLTGAISSVSNETLVRGGNNNTVGAMQGTVSGVNIIKNNNKPGGGYSIDMRGLSSISSSTTPLIVIDGVPGANLDMMNPDDIEKIDILKDASATAIYGSRGANGVVIVTTKRGKLGKPRISYSGYAGFRKYTNEPDMMSGDEYVQLAREARRATNNNVYVPDEQILMTLQN